MQPTNKPLIGITGYKGSGKSEAASLLWSVYDYGNAGFADELKREVYKTIGKAFLAQTYGGGLNPHSFQDWMQFIDQHKHDSAQQDYGWVRPLLQHWGTWRRDTCGLDYWIKKLMPKLVPGFAIYDVRFPNEAQAIRDKGGIIWRIHRPGKKGDSHISETSVDMIVPDTEIHNEGTVAQLRLKVRDVMEEILTARGE